MFKSAQVLASTTLLCGVLALSGCGASQAGQEMEDTSARPAASASVEPGKISVAKEGTITSVAPGSITVANGASAGSEHHESTDERPHSESESHTETHESKQDSSKTSEEVKHEESPQLQKEDGSGASNKEEQQESRIETRAESNTSTSTSDASGASGDSSRSANSSSKRSNSSNPKPAEGPSQCNLDDLNISITLTSTPPDARIYTMYFQNSSDAPCTLRGYPRVVHAGPSGTWVGREAINSAEYMNPSGVTIIPGDSVPVLLRSVNPARFGEDCGSRPVQGFLVGLAGSGEGVVVPLETSACSASVPQLSVGQFGAR